LAVVTVGERPLLHHTGGMLTFNSSLHVDPEGGVAAFASTNAGDLPYRPRQLTAYACERMRAARDGTPAPKPRSASPAFDPADDRRGRYVSQTGRSIEIRAAPGGLYAIAEGPGFAVEAAGEDILIAKDPAATPDALVFRRRQGRVERLWWGRTEFVRDAPPLTVAFTAPPTADLAALTGRYVSDDPWRGGFAVTAQGQQLYIDGTMPLTRLPDGAWRVGEKPWSPERVCFDAEAGGRPMRAILSGADYLRREA
jgi:hypothetical protein